MASSDTNLDLLKLFEAGKQVQEFKSYHWEGTLKS